MRKKLEKKSIGQNYQKGKVRKDDSTCLLHMLDAAREAVSFVSGKSRNYLDKNRMLVLYLLKDIEIIGEAASEISVGTMAKFADIPWLDIIDMRSRLIDADYDMDLDVVWDTVTGDLPPLIVELEKIIPPEKRR